MSPTIALRTTELDRYRRRAELKTNEQLAAVMQAHPVTVGRVLKGEMQPGERFIAGALAASPGARFEELFEVRSS